MYRGYLKRNRLTLSLYSFKERRKGINQVLADVRVVGYSPKCFRSSFNSRKTLFAWLAASIFVERFSIGIQNSSLASCQPSISPPHCFALTPIPIK